MTEELKEALKNHMEADQRTFDAIGQTLDKIKDNHLFHIEKDMATQTTNVAWLMKAFWLVAGTSVTAVITGVLNLILK